MVFRASPDLGPGLTAVYDDPAFFDNQRENADVSPQLGTVCRGSDGGEYFWVKASGSVAATATTGTEVDMTFSDHTIKTKEGTGGFWTAPGVAVSAGQFCWVRRGAWNATPA